MDGVLGHVDIREKFTNHSYSSVKTYAVLESQYLYKGDNLVRIFVLQNVATKDRQLFTFKNTDKVWGDVKTLVEGDLVQLTWLVSIKNASNEIIGVKYVGSDK